MATRRKRRRLRNGSPRLVCPSIVRVVVQTVRRVVVVRIPRWSVVAPGESRLPHSPPPHRHPHPTPETRPSARLTSTTQNEPRRGCRSNSSTRTTTLQSEAVARPAASRVWSPSVGCSAIDKSLTLRMEALGARLTSTTQNEPRRGCRSNSSTRTTTLQRGMRTTTTRRTVWTTTGVDDGAAEASGGDGSPQGFSIGRRTRTRVQAQNSWKHERNEEEENRDTE
jgi:hypothetical protein